jgi:hypothetical protein
MAFELYIEDELIDLIGDEQISTDYAIAEIGNFATRSGFRSINFDIPKTANNNRILQNAFIVNNTTTRPYRRLKARVYVDGIDQNIRFADIESVQDTYNMRVYGGNANFFDIIKGKELIELSYLQTIDYLYNLGLVTNSRLNTNGYIFPIIDWHADSPNAIINNTSNEYDVRYCFPALFVNEIINNICIDAGYNLINNILNDNNYLKSTLIFPLTEPKPSSYLAIGEQTGTETKFNISLFDSLCFASIADDIQTDFQTAIKTASLNLDLNSILFTRTTDFYEIKADGNFKVTGKIIYSNSYTGISNPDGGVFLVDTTGIIIAAVAQFTPIIGIDVEQLINVNIDATTGQKLILYLRVDPSLEPLEDLTINAGTFIEVNANSVASNVFNTQIAITDLTPKLKQSDFLKAYLQMFSGLVTVDEDTKTVHINKFNELFENIPQAIDWSDKIDFTDENNLEFSLDKYGQQNSLEYKEDASVDPAFVEGANGTINIDDNTLPFTAEIVKLPFAATEMDTRLEAFVIPKIKIYRTNSSNETSISEKVIARILLLNVSNTASNIDFTDGTSNIVLNTSIPLAHFIANDKEYNLGFGNNLITLYYGGLQSVLTRTKIVTEQIRLNALDIQQLDFLKPVFLSKHNAYFYISKISGFTYGSSESTEVELVKLR